MTTPLLFARYRLMHLLGEGGMGRVWFGRDEVLHRDVAIKEVVLPPGLTAAERDEAGRRTLREARAAARLNHPNVVRVYDLVRAEPHAYIVMEYVPARSLHQVINDDGPLPPRRVAEIGLGVLAALTAAHRVGVQHRDVKPSNVLLTDDGRVVLTDFGLATVVGEAHVTRSGLILGSPAFISPERARDGTSGPESDMWSLGATLYAAVEGHSPYARSTAIATLTALATEEPPAPSRAGPLRKVLEGLLRKDPARRISADEAERVLRRVAGSRGGLRLAPTLAEGLPQITGAAGTVQSRIPRPRGQAAVAAPASDVRTPVEPLPAESTLAEPRPAESPPAESPPAESPPAGLAPDKPRRAEPPPQGPPPQGPPARSLPQAEPPPPGPPARGLPQAEPPPPGPPARGLPQAESPAQGPPQAEPPQAGPPPQGPPPQGPPPQGPPQAEPPQAGPPPQGPPPQGPPQAEPPQAGPPPQGPPPAESAGAEAERTEAEQAEAERAEVEWAGVEPAAGGGRRRGALIAAVALLVVVLVVAVVLTARSSGRQQPSTGSSQSVPTRTAVPGGAGPTTAAPTSAPTTAPAAAQLPAGWQLYRDPTGFSVPAPVGWTRTNEGTIVYFREPNGSRVLGIDQTNQPQPDPVADWTRQEAQRANSFYPGYQRIKIVPVNYWLSCADWEFTYNAGGVRAHVIDRGFITSSNQAYAIWWSAPDSQWADNLKYFELITTGFQPKQ